MEQQTRLSLEFLAVMTMIGVAVAVLVLIIDQQIKRDIVTHATSARRSVDELTALLAQRGDLDHARPTPDAADSAD